jgi:hypothetical protein
VVLIQLSWVLTRVGEWQELLLLQCRPAFPQQRLPVRRLPFGYVLPEELLMLPVQRGAGPTDETGGGPGRAPTSRNLGADAAVAT